ncbi:hypothetical protein [Rhodococcus sp. 114MFTsu3.1]|uniref:hypothetical protein n=1 Tax=Rhodococcus sp. 114MFTsu3.1 TaxID=1172184 RepID=UPI0003A0401F|nr:hypothetical protein [Rhodococcus sp. 114MFTsu3.1]
MPVLVRVGDVAGRVERVVNAAAPSAWNFRESTWKVLREMLCSRHSRETLFVRFPAACSATASTMSGFIENPSPPIHDYHRDELVSVLDVLKHQLY